MNSIAFSDPYEALRPLMSRHGVTCSARDFYWAVNQAYHTVEAQLYDELHEAMFLGLEPVWRALLARVAGHPTGQLRVLDIGAGTGLVGGFVEMHLSSRVSRMTMLDPCRAMLEKCQRRAELFSFPCEFRQGDIDVLAEGEQFDVITVNSVLHHIVELPEFFARVRALLAPQGWLLTAQDPRAGAASDPTFRTRCRVRRRARRSLGRAAWSHFSQVWRRMLGRADLSPLAMATSSQLLAQQTIRRPMTMSSIYSVTDFHVPGQPGNIGKGLCVESMREWLGGALLAEDFTYQFYGLPWTSLTPAEQQQEKVWWQAHDKHGELLATAWCKDARA